MWKVYITRKASKALDRLPEATRMRIFQLLTEIEVGGPMTMNWPNFSKLTSRSNEYHCHVKKGRPTYVACWRKLSNEPKTVEVYYVGTHENAPYK